MTSLTTAGIFGPIVYIFRSADKCLYIGSSKNGLGRALQRNHHRFSEIIECAVVLEYIVCDSIISMHKLERDLIWRENPRFNVVHSHGTEKGKRKEVIERRHTKYREEYNEWMKRNEDVEYLEDLT